MFDTDAEATDARQGATKQDDAVQAVTQTTRAEDVAQSMGMLLKNDALHCWLSRGDAEHALGVAYVQLLQALGAADALSFRFENKTLTVGEQEIPADGNPLVRVFCDHLREREIVEFSLARNVTQTALRQFLDLLEAPADELRANGGFGAALGLAAIQNVKVRRVVLQAVDEDEVIVRKQFVADHEKHGAGILAFLRGQINAESEEARRQAHEISSDIDKLVELIMRAADVKQAPAALQDGESLTDVVVGSLRRTFSRLMKSSLAETQKGRKLLSRTLVMLEKEVLATLRGLAGETTEEDARAVAESIESLRDDLEMDVLANDYVRQRRATEKTEKRILRHMRAEDGGELSESELRTRLAESGLSIEEWQELVFRSRQAPGATGGAGDGGDGLQSLSHLATLLRRMELLASQTGAVTTLPDPLAETANHVRHAMALAMRDTEQKMRTLATDVRAAEKAERTARKAGRKKEAEETHLSRQHMLEMLAEIVQELCQPLSVINCSLQMVITDRLGPVSEGQRSMLNLANEAAERIFMLTNSLRKISGDPEKLEPDLKLTASFYR